MSTSGTPIRKRSGAYSLSKEQLSIRDFQKNTGTACLYIENWKLKIINYGTTASIKRAAGGRKCPKRYPAPGLPFHPPAARAAGTRASDASPVGKTGHPHRTTGEALRPTEPSAAPRKGARRAPIPRTEETNGWPHSASRARYRPHHSARRRRGNRPQHDRRRIR